MAKKTGSKKKKVATKKSASRKKRLSPKATRKKSVAKKATKRTAKKASKKAAKPKVKKAATRTVKKASKKAAQPKVKKATKRTVKKASKKAAQPKVKKAASRQKPKSRKTTLGKKSISNPILTKIHERLIRNRQEIFKILQASREVERNPSELNFSNEIDLAANLEGREMAFTLSSRDRDELKLIEDALFKISRGTYGTCESCTKAITTKRLEIMPLTPYCIECQATMERP